VKKSFSRSTPDITDVEPIALFISSCIFQASVENSSLKRAVYGKKRPLPVRENKSALVERNNKNLPIGLNCVQGVLN